MYDESFLSGYIYTKSNCWPKILPDSLTRNSATTARCFIIPVMQDMAELKS